MVKECGLKMRIVDVLQTRSALYDVTVYGWVKTRRDAKGFSFLEINDGSCLENMQIVADAQMIPHAQLALVTTGAAVAVSGDVIKSLGQGQEWELTAKKIFVFGSADPETYPLQKKRHSDEFLRSIAHLRPRTNKYGAMFRVRSETAFAIHEYFREHNFFAVHSPILTGSDCEGAGELFRVTTLLPDGTSRDGHKFDPGNPYAHDFFGRDCQLTVSGQLEAENLAMALGKVYSFGPTFRAENSNTPRHCAEFWMVEPEMAFADLTDLMDLAEDLTRTITKRIFTRCQRDLELFNRFVDPELFSRLELLTEKPFIRISYKDAITILEQSGKKFEYPVFFGSDLQTEHERFLAEEYCKQAVIVYDYPKTIKAFYMRLNDDRSTVAAMDVLIPRIGELIGGSQREERLLVLTERLEDLGHSLAEYWWYLDLRRYGSAPHAGFGLGFERLLMLLTGISNIRDVIPFPRTPGSLDF